ncbi:MAG: hypothetical protein R3Y56_01695 [Akkermansia sp.]
MEDTRKEMDTLREDELVELLSQLYIEPVKEAHFEERFLVSFHEKVVQQAVCQPARVRLWENLHLFFSGLNKVKLAFSSVTFLGFGALTLATTNWAVNSDSAPATASRERVMRNMIASADSLRASSVLPSSLEAPSELQINVANPQMGTGFTGGKGGILFEQECFDVPGAKPNISSADSDLGNNFSW